MVVLVAAALFYRSFRETRDMDPGFKREGVLLAAYDLSGRNIDTLGARDVRGAAPGTRSRDCLRWKPPRSRRPYRSTFTDCRCAAFTLEGRARADASPDLALANLVTPGYFRTMGIPLEPGRDFADLNDADAPPQAIVNEEFVRRFLDGGEALGRRLQVRSRTYTIVGVVQDLDIRFVRRVTEADHLLLVSRSADARRRDSRAHACRARRRC